MHVPTECSFGSLFSSFKMTEENEGNPDRRGETKGWTRGVRIVPVRLPNGMTQNFYGENFALTTKILCMNTLYSGLLASCYSRFIIEAINFFLFLVIEMSVVRPTTRLREKYLENSTNEAGHPHGMP